jgi:succinate dehydrogenase/fumarate reductase-like Fe-S protein
MQHSKASEMAAIEFNLNDKTQTVDANPTMPLLWVLRDLLGLTGTKFGCGMALCGACTVHVNGIAVRSCTMQVSMYKESGSPQLRVFLLTRSTPSNGPGSNWMFRSVAIANPGRS